MNGRKPFAQDVDMEYDYDSELEWEEEDDSGEELKSDEEDKEEEEPVDEEEEDGWMVPHGYLSDDEGVECETDQLDLKKAASVFLISSFCRGTRGC